MNRWMLSFLCTTFLILIIGLKACTTEPFTIEVAVEPEPEMVDTLSLIMLTEENVCDSDIISFKREILPIISSSCAYAGCHDEASAQGFKILTNYDDIIHHVVPGSPEFSSMFLTIKDDVMPPSGLISLNNDQKWAIEKWILQGAENTDCNLPCESLNRSYSEDIYPIIQRQCLGCHQSNNASAGIDLSTYEDIQSLAIDGSLLASIQHETGVSPMPKLAQKLTDCQIGQIQNWILEGAQNN